MQHLDEGTIHAWLDGELPPDERARLEQHIGQCADCAALVADARGMIAGASRIVSALDVVPSGVIPLLPQKSAPKSLWRSLRLTPARAALAASLLVAAGTLLTVRHESDLNVAPTRTSVAAAPAPSAPATPSVTPANGQARHADEVQRTDRPEPAKTGERALAQAPAGASSGKVAASSGAGAAGAIASAPPAAPPPVSTPAPASATATAASQVAALAEAKSIEARSVAKSAPAPAPQRAMTDSVSARDASGAPGFAGRRAANAAGASALSQLVVTGIGVGPLRSGLGGCYQTVTGGAVADSSLWPHLLPSRFQLAPIDSGLARGSVRAVTPDGRIDSLVPGTVWRPVSDNLANLEWVMGTQARTLTLRLVGGPPVGQAAANGQGRMIGITRADCRR